jgi:hypothetical protein
MIHLSSLPQKYPGDAKEEFRYAWPIAAAMEKSPEFCRWIVAKSGLDGADNIARLLSEEQLAKRSKGTTYWWRHPWCYRECRFIGCGETDLLAVFELDLGRRVAPNIEVKNPKDKLGQDQVTRHLRRSECWQNAETRPESILGHEQGATILVCSEAFEQSHHGLARQFDRVISIECLTKQISPYPLPELV